MEPVNEAERLYRESKDAILDLVTDTNQRLPVPACPGWELRDIVAHLTGSLIDLITGNTRGAPGPAWTAGHVERFSARDLFEIKDLWIDAVRYESAALFERMGTMILPDIVTHEFDVRGTLGNTDARDSERLHVALRALLGWLGRSWREQGLPALELDTGQQVLRLGIGEPRGRVRATAFEIGRVVTGRRSDAQVRALDWSTDPSPWLPHLSTLGRRDTDLVE